MLTQQIKVKITDKATFDETKFLLELYGYNFLFGYERHLFGIHTFENGNEIGFYTNNRDYERCLRKEVTKNEINNYSPDYCPVKDFVNKNAEGIKGIDGTYYSYKEVCELIEKYSKK